MLVYIHHRTKYRRRRGRRASMIKHLRKSDKYGTHFLNRALSEASTDGNLEATKLLLDVGASINHYDHNFNTPLHLAVQNRHFKVTQLLLDRCADINKKGGCRRVFLYAGREERVREEWTSLLYAIAEKKTVMFQLLLDRGANINYYGNRGHLNGLHLAFLRLYMFPYTNDFKLAQFLLDHGTCIDLQDDQGRTSILGHILQYSWLDPILVGQGCQYPSSGQ